jgi:hypothetical protein
MVSTVLQASQLSGAAAMVADVDGGMHPASRDRALAAVRVFHAEHSRLPRRRERERATESRPCAKTIERRWGWRELLAEALPFTELRLMETGGRR